MDVVCVASSINLVDPVPNASKADGQMRIADCGLRIADCGQLKADVLAKVSWPRRAISERKRAASRTRCGIKIKRITAASFGF